MLKKAALIGFGIVLLFGKIAPAIFAKEQVVSVKTRY